jgi:hypothetical protein
VDRERLFGFSGRSRKPQMALARTLGFDDYAQPAGGCCFLTDARYSVKLADLWRTRGDRDYELDDIMLLKVGRHIRPNPGFKLIVSREEGEGRFMQGYRKRFTSLTTLSHPGPLALIDGRPREEEMELAARIVARYSQGRAEDAVELELAQPDGSARRLRVRPLPANELPAEWIL